MALPIGFLLFILGLVAYWRWLPETFWFLQGLVTASLLFWGMIALLVGYSEYKARRECDAAMHDETAGANGSAKKAEAGPDEAAAEPASIS